MRVKVRSRSSRRNLHDSDIVDLRSPTGLGPEVTRPGWTGPTGTVDATLAAKPHC